MKEGGGYMKKKFWQMNSRTVSNLLIVLIGILFYVLLSNFGVIRQKIGDFLDVIAPFIAGFAVAYLLNTPVSFFERKVYYKLRCKRGLSIATVYLLAVLIVVVLINMIIPQVVSSAIDLVNNSRSYLNNLNSLVESIVSRFELEGEGLESVALSYEDLVGRALSLVSTVLPRLVNYGMALGSGVIAAITALISSIYMLSGKSKLISQIKAILFAMFPVKKVENFLGICHRANHIFVGFINGKVIDSAIIGVLCFILCLILRIPYAPLISVFIGLTNIIPFFGPLIGAIPSIMILVIINPFAALRFVIMVILLQQFDGNILGPKILSDSTGLSAIWVLVAIIVGGGLFGFVGMLLGVPTFAVLYMLTRDLVTARLNKKKIDRDGKPLEPAKIEISSDEERQQEIK